MKDQSVPKSKSLLARCDRVAPNLLRDPLTDRYYGVKKINGARKMKALKMGEGRNAWPVTDRATANGKLQDWLRDLKTGNPAAVKLRLEALLQKFLKVREIKSKSTRASEKGYASVLRQGFARGMNVMVSETKTSDLLEFLATENNARNWAPRTHNGMRLFLRKMFDLAVADGIVTDTANPFRPKLIPARKLRKTVRNIPTREQFEKIIATVRAQKGHLHEQSADFLSFLGLAGVGQAEAANLKWRDIDSDRIFFVRRKTERSFRIPIYPWLRPLVEKLRLARESTADDDAPVFTIRDAGNALENACKRLTFPHFTQRNLRAMCIKRLYDSGVPAKRIALWQGHSDGGWLIQRTYTEVFCDTDSAAEAADLARLAA